MPTGNRGLHFDKFSIIKAGAGGGKRYEICRAVWYPVTIWYEGGGGKSMVLHYRLRNFRMAPYRPIGLVSFYNDSSVWLIKLQMWTLYEIFIKYTRDPLKRQLNCSGEPLCIQCTMFYVQNHILRSFFSSFSLQCSP